MINAYIQPKVLGNGEELILKSLVYKSMPSPSSNMKKSLSLCTKRCLLSLQRETSKEAKDSRFYIFQKIYLCLCFPQVQINMQGQDSPLRRGLGYAG